MWCTTGKKPYAGRKVKNHTGQNGGACVPARWRLLRISARDLVGHTEYRASKASRTCGREWNRCGLLSGVEYDVVHCNGKPYAGRKVKPPGQKGGVWSLVYQGGGVCWYRTCCADLSDFPPSLSVCSFGGRRLSKRHGAL